MTGRRGASVSSRTTSAVSVGIPVLGALVGVPVTLASPTAATYYSWLPDFLVGWLFFAAAGWAYRPSRAIAGSAALVGSLWFLGSVLPVASLWHRGSIAHVVLLWPLIRPQRVAALVAVALGYLINAVPSVAAGPAISFAFAAALIAVGAGRRLGRREGLVPLAVALGLGAGIVGGHAVQAVVAGSIGVYAGLLVYEAGVASIALVLGVSARRSAAADPTDVVLELRRAHGGARAGDDAVLRRALHDLDAPTRSEALAQAQRLTNDNAELERVARERLRTLTESRDRLAAAERDERARIRHLLDDELSPLFDEVRSALAALGPSAGAERIRHRVEESAAEIDSLRLELGTTGSTDVAAEIVALASRSPIPVSAHGLPRRLPSAVAEAVRYICSEALLNAVKHSGASSVVITGHRRRGRWVVAVADDGRGGATANSGSGLRGLVVRAHEVGADVELHSPPGGGTRVSVILPRSGHRGARRRP